MPEDTPSPRFTLLGELGRGGMAVVHLARDNHTGQQVALKLLHAHLADRPSSRRRLERELATSRAIAHPAVVPVLEQIDVDGRPGLVLPLLAGGTLAEHIAVHGPLPEDRLRTLAHTLADALRTAHTCGVLHRDVTPSNVLLDPTESPAAFRLTDFGLARFADTHTATTTVLGTPGYAAPESGGLRSADPALDAYALGAVLHFAATGQAPFGSDAPAAVLARQLQGTPVPPLRTARPDLSADLVATIDGLLHPDPTRRLTLAHARYGPPPTAAPTPDVGRRNRGPTGAAVSLVALALLGCFQDFGAFLLSTILDGHAIPRADVFQMTQGVSALLLLPGALVPAVVGALTARSPDPLAARRWAGLGILAILVLVYALAAGVVMPELRMTSPADLFGTMLFHEMVFLPVVLAVVALVRPWSGLRTVSPPTLVPEAPTTDTLVDTTRRTLADLRADLSRVPDVVRLDLHDALRNLDEAVTDLAHRRSVLAPAAVVELPAVDALEARLARARTFGSPDLPDLTRALAAAEATRAEHDAREQAWTLSSARLIEIQAIALKARRELLSTAAEVPVTEALAHLQARVAAAVQARQEVEAARPPMAARVPDA